MPYQPAPAAQTFVYYGADAPRDAAHAAQLAGAPGVSLRPVAGEGRHSILYPMLRTGLMAQAIDDLLAAGRRS